MIDVAKMHRIPSLCNESRWTEYQLREYGCQENIFTAPRQLGYKTEVHAIAQKPGGFLVVRTDFEWSEHRQDWTAVGQSASTGTSNFRDLCLRVVMGR